ncbi:protein kinase domain-containing protein [Geodermatophilus sp. URMC 63]
MTTVERGRQTLGGRYELQALIATGGMGQVWRGRDTLLDRAVAVKVLRSEYADDPTFLARFRAEARHAAALSHPNIAAVLDYGEGRAEDTGEHLAYLVMELVDGAPLSALLTREGPLEPDTALSVLSQAAAGLAEAHRAGVVHRDVKPGNILVRPDGGVKLTDFGIAWSAESVPLTGTGQVIGTAQYMSPEQAAGERVGPASDVYALGLVGYESLTGRAAFTGTNPVAVALKQVREDPEPLPADLPPDVRNLIDAALTKDPGERLPDGAAFLHALEDTVHPRHDTAPVAAAATRPVAPAGQPPARASRTAPAGEPAAGDGRRRRLLLALAVLAVVLLGGGAVALVGGLSDGDAPAATAAPSEEGIVLAAADYVGRPAEDVARELTDLGLSVGEQTTVTPDAAPGTVTRLDPAGTEVATGDRVRLVVAAAPPAVPDDPAATGPATTASGGQAPSPSADEPTPGTAADTAPGQQPGATAPGTGDARAGATAPGTEDAEDAAASSGDAGAGDPTPEPAPEPTSDPTSEPTTDPTSEPTTDATSEPTTDATAESAADPATGSASQPATESASPPAPSSGSASQSAPSSGAPTEPAGGTGTSPSAGSGTATGTGTTDTGTGTGGSGAPGGGEAPRNGAGAASGSAAGGSAGATG